MSVIDPSEFARAMAHVPTPVTVVTTLDRTGRRWGFTASSFSSLSLDPPLVLVCPARTASCHGAFVAADRFLVNVLSVDQSAVARHFARSGHDKFADGDMEPCEYGLPGLSTAAARVACTLHEVLDGGDHSILVGRVDAVFIGGSEPLVYYNRDFTRPENLALTAAG
ncbi:flavin reductase family protein [Streptomyces sp. BA2]|uniref:flavin reductase family protein n=1 Tax=Streptomyces sp. BA2 TaxID=436595 RepID=UPI001F3FA522|nr:flavin reductase family protein [Streptomyces sp. BA2]